MPASRTVRRLAPTDTGYCQDTGGSELSESIFLRTFCTVVYKGSVL